MSSNTFLILVLIILLLLAVGCNHQRGDQADWTGISEYIKQQVKK